MDGAVKTASLHPRSASHQVTVFSSAVCSTEHCTAVSPPLPGLVQDRSVSLMQAEDRRFVDCRQGQFLPWSQSTSICAGYMC